MVLQVRWEVYKTFVQTVIEIWFLRGCTVCIVWLVYRSDHKCSSSSESSMMRGKSCCNFCSVNFCSVFENEWLYFCSVKGAWFGWGKLLLCGADFWSWGGEWFGWEKLNFVGDGWETLNRASSAPVLGSLSQRSRVSN